MKTDGLSTLRFLLFSQFVVASLTPVGDLGQESFQLLNIFFCPRVNAEPSELDYLRRGRLPCGNVPVQSSGIDPQPFRNLARGQHSVLIAADRFTNVKDNVSFFVPQRGRHETCLTGLGIPQRRTDGRHRSADKIIESSLASDREGHQSISLTHCCGLRRDWTPHRSRGCEIGFPPRQIEW